MIWIDYAIIAAISFSALVSLVRGFVREALSLISYGCIFFIANQFYLYLSTCLTRFDDWLIKIIPVIIILFVMILIMSTIVNYGISSLVKRIRLSGSDCVLGACFGILRGILIVSAVLFFLDTFTQFPKTEDWRRSELIPQFNHIIIWFFDYIKTWQ